MIQTSKSQSDVIIVRKSLDGVKGLSVLEKIRLRKQQKVECVDKSKPKISLREKAVLSRLTSFVDLIYCIVHKQERRSFYMKELLQKATDTYQQPLSLFEAKELLVKLAQIAPQWISLVETEFGQMVSINSVTTTRKDVMTQVQLHVDSKLSGV
ncbi:hypothetical protein MIR68_007994 [Amoeboaphelidium protococcarum]|nr:hypothetical protein MIR68_007994 [Amoeboaphelidium protococcarum]